MLTTGEGSKWVKFIFMSWGLSKPVVVIEGLLRMVIPDLLIWSWLALVLVHSLVHSIWSFLNCT